MPFLLHWLQLVDMWFMSGAKQRQAVAREYTLERRRMWSGLDKLTSSQRLKSVNEMGLAPAVKAAAVTGASGGLPSSSAFSAAASAVLDFQATVPSPNRSLTGRNTGPLHGTRGRNDIFDGSTTVDRALWASDGEILAGPTQGDGKSAEIAVGADIGNGSSDSASVELPQPLPLATRLSLATARARTAGSRKTASRGDNPVGPSLLAFAQAASQREEQRHQSRSPSNMDNGTLIDINNNAAASTQNLGDSAVPASSDWPLQQPPRNRVGTAATTSSRASVTRGARGRVVAAQSIRSIAPPLELERAKPRPSTHQLMVATYANGRTHGPRSATPAQARSHTVGGGKSFVAPPLPPRRADARSSPLEWVAALAASGLGAAKATQIATLVHEEEKAEINRAAVFEDALQRHAKAQQNLQAKHAKAAAAGQAEIQACQDAANELYSRQNRRVKREPPPLSLLVNPPARKTKLKTKSKEVKSTALVAVGDSNAAIEDQEGRKSSSEAEVVAALGPSILADEAKLQADAVARVAAAFKQAATLVKQALRSEQDASRCRSAEAAALEASGAQEQAALLAMFRKQRDAFMARLARFAGNYNPAPALPSSTAGLAYGRSSDNNALTLRSDMNEIALISEQNGIGKVLEGGAVDLNIWAEGSDTFVDSETSDQDNDRSALPLTREPEFLPLLGGVAEAKANSDLEHRSDKARVSNEMVTLPTSPMRQSANVGVATDESRGNSTGTTNRRHFDGIIPAAVTDAAAAPPTPLFEGRRALASRGSSIVSLPNAHSNSSGHKSPVVGNRPGIEIGNSTDAVPRQAAGSSIQLYLMAESTTTQNTDEKTLRAVDEASSLQDAQDSKKSSLPQKRTKTIKKQKEDDQQWFQRSAAGGQGYEQAPPELQMKESLNINSKRVESWLPTQSLSAEERHQAYHFGVPLSLELLDLTSSSNEQSGQLLADPARAAATSTALVSVDEKMLSSVKGGETLMSSGLAESKICDVVGSSSDSEAGVAANVNAAFVAVSGGSSGFTLSVPTQLLVALSTLRGRRPAESALLSQLRSFRAKAAHMSAVDTMNKEILRAALVARGVSNEALKDCEEMELKTRFKTIIDNEDKNCSGTSDADQKFAAIGGGVGVENEKGAIFDSSTLSPGAAAAHALLTEASALVDECKSVPLMEFSQFASALNNAWGLAAEVSSNDINTDGGGAVYDCNFSTLNLGLRFRFVAALGIIEVAANDTESEALNLQEQESATNVEGTQALQQQQQQLKSTLPRAGDLLLACNGNPLGWMRAPGTFQDALMTAPRPLRLTLQRPFGQNFGVAVENTSLAAASSASSPVVFEWNTDAVPAEVEDLATGFSESEGVACFTHERIFDQIDLGFTIKFVAVNGGSLVVAAALKPQVTGPLLRAGDVLVACNNQEVGPIVDPKEWQLRLARSRPVLISFMRTLSTHNDHSSSSSSATSKRRSEANLKVPASAINSYGDTIDDGVENFAPPRYPHGRVELGPGMGAAVGFNLR